MDFYTFIIASLIVGLFAVMTADIILDMETIWNGLETERGSGRVDEKQEYPERPRPNKIADISWVQIVEDSEPIPEVDIITLAKSRQKPKVIQAGVKVRELLDGLGKQVRQLVNYSDMTIRELKAIAKQRRLPRYGSMRKAELIAALQS